MRGGIICNRYYSDSGLDYMVSRLKAEFNNRDIDIEIFRGVDIEFTALGQLKSPFNLDFAVFLDKDIYVADSLEKLGIKIFNSSNSILYCDDKVKTYLKIADAKIKMPTTLLSHLRFDINNEIDDKYLDFVENTLKYPLVVKENFGSQGRQVYLANDRQELNMLYHKVMHIPHMYQQFIEKSAGRDIRLYVIGHEVVAACRRENTTDFKSNVARGGQLKIIEPKEEFSLAAKKISKMLNLDYGSIDFFDLDEPIFIEANSNAYFKTIESLGVDIAGKLVTHIVGVLQC